MKEHFLREKLSPEDRKILKFLIDELDNLKEDSYFQQGKPVITEHVVIPNVVELRDVTSNTDLAAACLQGIHKIMEKYWVEVEMYRQLDRCFVELGIQPLPMLQKQ